MDGISEAPKDKVELLNRLVKEIDKDYEWESRARDEMLKDHKFEHGKGWWGDLREARGADRPCLTVPRTNVFIDHVRNQQRQNKASFEIFAEEDSQVKKAMWRQKKVRQIMYDSNGADACQFAYDAAVGHGRGWFRISTDYVSEDAVDEQKIMVGAIRDWWNVIPGRHRREISYSDMTRCTYQQYMDKEVFKETYPDADTSSFEGQGEANRWNRQDDVLIANVYCKWAKKRERVKFEDGSKVWWDEVPADRKKELEPYIVARRTVREPYIKLYRINKYEILEETDIPGKWIPMIPVVGHEEIVDGEVMIYAIMRRLRDIGKMYNFLYSEQAEDVAYASKAKVIAAAGQIEKYHRLWSGRNRKAFAALIYDPKDKNGTLLPPPQFIPNPGVRGDLVTAMNQCVEDMKAVTGIWSASLSEPGNERSGRAIFARQQQTDNANFNYPDNFRISMTHAGRIINNWIPVYYPEGTETSIREDEDDERVVTVGEIDRKTQEPVDWGEGEFGIRVTMGSNAITQRQEAANMIMEFIRVFPNVAPIISDVFVGNLEFKDSKKLADRLKKLLPPQVMEQEGGEKAMAMRLQQAIQQVQKDEQLIQILQKQMQEMERELETKGIENRTKIEVQKIRSATDIAVANIRALEDENKMANQASQFWFQQLQQQQTQPQEMTNV